MQQATIIKKTAKTTTEYARDRVALHEDQLLVEGAHNVGRVLHVHAAQLLGEGGELASRQGGRLHTAGTHREQSAPQQHPEGARHQRRQLPHHVIGMWHHFSSEQVSSLNVRTTTTTKTFK